MYNNDEEYDDDDMNKMKEYCVLITSYKDTLCCLIEYVDDLKIMSMKLKIKLPFIKKYINDEKNETDLLENGSILLKSKEIINNFDINNMFEFSEYYNGIAAKNEFLDLIDDFVISIKRKKADITKDNINAIKGLFEYIFDILEKITVLFN
jgi:hypothetical protein